MLNACVYALQVEKEAKKRAPVAPFFISGLFPDRHFAVQSNYRVYWNRPNQQAPLIPKGEH
ncbi:MAG: hypothetical protein ACI9R8_001443 [Candidatus Paceibacteria bacterium]|jgi:hypothetical protein